MKSKITTVLGVALCSMLALSMNVFAGGMNLSASVTPTSIPQGNVAYVEASWTATDQDFGYHTKCYAIFIFKDFFEDPMFEVDGEYEVGVGGSGAVTVRCSGDNGWAWYNWTTTETGTFYVEVGADGWDEDTPPDYIYEGMATNQFTVY